MTIHWPHSKAAFRWGRSPSGSRAATWRLASCRTRCPCLRWSRTARRSGLARPATRRETVAARRERREQAASPRRPWPRGPINTLGGEPVLSAEVHLRQCGGASVLGHRADLSAVGVVRALRVLLELGRFELLQRRAGRWRRRAARREAAVGVQLEPPRAAVGRELECRARPVEGDSVPPTRARGGRRAGCRLRSVASSGRRWPGSHCSGPGTSARRRRSARRPRCPTERRCAARCGRRAARRVWRAMAAARC